MKAWDQFLAKLEKDWGVDVVERWLRPLEILRFDAANLVLKTQDPLVEAWFEEHVEPRLKKKEFRNENHRPIKVHLQTGDKKGRPPPMAGPLLSFGSDPIDPSFSLTQFATTAENEMAFKLLEDLSVKGASPFNPIFLYGPPQSGKTHLLMGAAAKLGKRALFVSADTFTEHVVQAIRSQQMKAFRTFYRKIDVLLVDDVDRFSRRTATQEEFFHTFNALHTLGKQIVLTSARAPAALEDIEPRLTSRFEWGLAIPLGKGDLRSILQKKGEQWNVVLSAEILEFLAIRFPKEPILALHALVMRGVPPYSVASAEKLLADLLAKEAQRELTAEHIVLALSAHFGIKPEDLLGKGQTREFSWPRQLGMYVCRESLKMPFQAIGKVFGRDHSTVMSSVEQVQAQVEAKRSDALEAIQAALRN